MSVLHIDDVNLARQGCRIGAGAAAFVAGVTVVVALASVAGVQAVPGATIDLLALIDAVLFGAIAWGLLRRSRVAAVLGLALFVLEKLAMPVPGSAVEWGIVLVLGGCFAWATVCAFEHHRLLRAGEVAATPEDAAPDPAR